MVGNCVVASGRRGIGRTRDLCLGDDTSYADESNVLGSIHSEDARVSPQKAR